MIAKHTFLILMMSVGALTNVKAQDTTTMDLKACMRYAVEHSTKMRIAHADNRDAQIDRYARPAHLCRRRSNHDGVQQLDKERRAGGCHFHPHHRRPELGGPNRHPCGQQRKSHPFTPNRGNLHSVLHHQTEWNRHRLEFVKTNHGETQRDIGP